MNKKVIKKYVMLTAVLLLTAAACRTEYVQAEEIPDESQFLGEASDLPDEDFLAADDDGSGYGDYMGDQLPDDSFLEESPGFSEDFLMDGFSQDADSVFADPEQIINAEGEGTAAAPDNSGEEGVNTGNETLDDTVILEDQDGISVSGVIDGVEQEDEAADREQLALSRAISYLQEPYAEILPAQKDRIRRTLEELSNTPNPTGSDQELKIGGYIADTMAKLGYHVSTQDFHEGFLNEDMIDAPGMNILAEKEVNAEPVTEDIILVVAHYDSKRNMQETDFLANDKTGAAVALETARLVAELETGTDICFVFLSGEEDGFYGSASFAETIKPFMKRIIGVIGIGPCGYAQIVPVSGEETQGSLLEETEAQPAPENTEETETQPVPEETEELHLVLPYALETGDGEVNTMANILLAAAAVQKLTLPSGMGDTTEKEEDSAEPADGIQIPEETEEPEEQEKQVVFPENRFFWEIEKDEESSLTAFSAEGLKTVHLYQKFEEKDLSGKTVRIAPEESAMAEAADILARMIGMYMAGIR